MKGDGEKSSRKKKIEEKITKKRLKKKEREKKRAQGVSWQWVKNPQEEINMKVLKRSYVEDRERANQR